MKTPTVETAAALLYDLTNDELRRFILMDGTSLAQEANRLGWASPNNLGNFLKVIREMREDELIAWDYYLGTFNHRLMTDGEFINCHNFRLTAKGLTFGREAAKATLAGLIPCSELLTRLNWTSALQELEAADKQHREGHWRDAVREYARALESAFKNAIVDKGKVPKDSLHGLSNQAIVEGLLLPEYLPLCDVVRSVRNAQSHGQGPATQAVDPKAEESLLLGNLVRALILYLGHGAHPGLMV